MKGRWFVPCGMLVLALAMLIGSTAVQSADTEDKADGINLMPADIHKAGDVEINLSKQPIKVAIAYAQ